MKKVVLPLLVLLAAVACGEKKEDFAIYPGAQAQPQLLELFKKASTTLDPHKPIPPQVIYDTDASLEDVAAFYAKENGYPKVFPDSTGNLSSVPPPAFYRTGDLRTDLDAIQPILKKMNMNVDSAKAAGKYRGAHISANGDRPRVTLSRPYFDPTKQQVVDRTLIIMVKE
ncbi:MAG: hypothetical protein QOI24_3187 [Acidobacteriota bacterium]|nr:hypothetical protein [Acidobacteriota bacterium]